MNVWGLEGHKVKVTKESAENGRYYDREDLKRYCKIGEEYTVDYTEVGSWHTNVFLKEFPNVNFNSVNFEDVMGQPKYKDKLHKDWKRYNN